MPKKRLLFICQYFYPEVFRGNDIAFDMAKKGVDVTVICGTPNYPQGKFFKGYDPFKRNREIIDGVTVIRIPIIPRGTGSKIQLMLNFFSYFVNASLYLPFHLLLRKKYDACFVQQLSPVMMSFPGVVFKKLTHRKLYTWVLDLWPESIKVAGGINNRRILGFFGWFSKLEYKNSDCIYVSSKGFKKNIITKGDFAHKIKFLPNWAEDAIKSSEILPIPALPKGFNVLFTGNIGEAQDFESIVEAARLLSPEESIHFIIVGDGRKKQWVENQISNHNIGDRIILLGRYDITYMHSFFNAADCMLLSLKDDEIMNLTVPAKMQAYLTSGKPIVAMINGDANELIAEINCGIAVDASNPAKLVNAIRSIKALSPLEREQMGRRGRQYCNENYDKASILNNLFNHIFKSSE